MPFPVVPLLDNFNRADVSIDNSVSSHDGTWFSPVHATEGVPAIVSNQLRTTVASSAALSVVYLPGVATSMTLAAVPSGGTFQLLFRIQASDTITYGAGATFIVCEWNSVAGGGGNDTLRCVLHINGDGGTAQTLETGSSTGFDLANADTVGAILQEVSTGTRVTMKYQASAGTWVQQATFLISSTSRPRIGRVGFYAQTGTWDFDSFSGQEYATPTLDASQFPKTKLRRAVPVRY